MTIADRWFRASPDSSVLGAPRLLARSLIDVADLDAAIAFHESWSGTPADLRMPIPDFGGLELAAVGRVLLIASARPFTPIQRRTAHSLVVPSLSASLEVVAAVGGDVLEPVEGIVPGARARVRYPDGAVAELVEHRPRPGEVPVPVPHVGDGLPVLSRKAVPKSEVDEVVRLYEAVLGVRAGGRHAVGAVDLVEVGGLLVIGSPERLDPEPRIALLVPDDEWARLRELAGAPAAAGPVGRSVLRLPDGLVVERWDVTS